MIKQTFSEVFLWILTSGCFSIWVFLRLSSGLLFVWSCGGGEVVVVVFMSHPRQYQMVVVVVVVVVAAAAVVAMPHSLVTLPIPRSLWGDWLGRLTGKP